MTNDVANASTVEIAPLIYCGWGRILLGNQFADARDLAQELANENRGKRDIAIYVDNPHVVLSYAPQQLFLDPSDTLRLPLDSFDAGTMDYPGLRFRRLRQFSDAEDINNLYLKRNMVPTESAFIWDNRDSAKLLFFVVDNEQSGEVLGTVMGVDHVAAFGAEDGGSSLWCLAVDPLAKQPRIGEYLVKGLASYFQRAGRQFMDLSVIHHNSQAKALYEKLGFHPIQAFSIKNKNAYNEALFIGPDLEEHLNPYAKIIVDEARARGIAVEVLDAEEGYFRLSRGGKSISCRESLSELTNAVAMSRCQDKYVTNRWLSKAGLSVSPFRLAGAEADNLDFLREHGALVVKPCVGEQGKGISVGVDNPEALHAAIGKAQQFCERVMLERFQPGEDLRIVVIKYRVVAAAVRKPAAIVGDGRRSARDLIEKQSRRREAATGGESRIPIDAETERCLAEYGFTLDSVPAEGQPVRVRKTANLHTGGTIHDVTHMLHPRLVDAAVKAARRLDIPVVGLDFIVTAADRPEHVIIEANERCGLANHEPQPTAERFIDLLFPLSSSYRARH